MIKDWIRRVKQFFFDLRVFMNLDVRFFDDPAWLLGTKPRKRTIGYLRKAEKMVKGKGK
jgi:hypothetical protein